MLRTFQYWIATKWPELDQDNLRMKFSALNVDFSSLKSRSPRFMEPGAGRRQKVQRFQAAQVYMIHKVAPRYWCWWRGVVGNAFRLKQSYSTPGPVSTAMGDYWTGTAIGFRASRELCSNYLLTVCISGLSRGEQRGWGEVEKMCWEESSS